MPAQGIAAGGMRDQIRTALEGVGLRPSQEMLSKCLNLATTLRVSPGQLAESWEAFSLNRSVSDLTNQNFDSYRGALRRDIENSSPSTSMIEGVGAVRPNSALGKRQIGTEGTVVTPTPKRGRGMRDSVGNVSAVDAVAVSPTSSPNAKSPLRKTIEATPGLKYEERAGVGKVVATYNPHGLQSSAADSIRAGRRRCGVSLLDECPNVLETYRYMFTPVEDRARALDEHLNDMGAVIMETHSIRSGLETQEESNGQEDEGETKIAPLEAVARPRQGKVCCIGRICNEAHEGRLNCTSLLIEGSRHHSNGARVNLDVSSLASKGANFSLFPGQIVAVEGVNASGLKMVADRICEGAAPPLAKTPTTDLIEYHHGTSHQGGGGLRIMTACGPYTTSDNLDYAPLNDLLAQVQQEKPDVVILSGPFVDLRQPLVQSGDVSLGLEDGTSRMTVSFETLFMEKVARELEDLFQGCYDEDGEELQTQFVLVPSLDDPVAESVYPQPPLSDKLPHEKELNLPRAEGITYGCLGLQHIETAGRKADSKATHRVHCVSNPCTFKINEVVFGITSTDVLLHISADTASANLEPGTRLTRIAQHLLQQRSYYPLFPPPAPSAAMCPPNLDLSKMKGMTMPVRPDVLIVPSKLTPFARGVLGGTVVVNPGTLSRGMTGGTYASMEIHPIDRDALEVKVDGDLGDNVKLEHGVQDRIYVDIKRI